MSGPGAMSRYLFATAYTGEDGVKELGAVEPYRFRELSDTRTHTVTDGDTLFSLAGLYYSAIPRGCGLWWAIADFQPEPIIDGTQELETGRVLYIPSERVILNEILGEARRRTA